jgi:site-specific DNA-methyltransferase (adenine-specific)
VGFGTALKPACEPIVLARKPLSESTVAANVLKWGTGALNIDGCRVSVDADEPNRRDNASIDRSAEGATYNLQKTRRNATLQNGRWPANVIHDGSDEVVGAFPETQTNAGTAQSVHRAGMWGIETQEGRTLSNGDSGSAARFFYTAKADADDRLGSNHPTVKPLDLMQYLVRLVTPPRGLVLDPFAGTGTTGEAAMREGIRAILIEREAEYQEDIRRRMRLATCGPDERSRESIKAKLKDKPLSVGPLFGALEL